MNNSGRWPEISDSTLEVWLHLLDSMSWLLPAPIIAINRSCGSHLLVLGTNASAKPYISKGSELPLLHTYCAQTLQDGVKTVVPDGRATKRWQNSIPVKNGFIAYIGLPIFWPDGEPFGTLCALDTKPHTWPFSSEKLIETVAAILTAQLMLMTQLQQLEYRNQQVHALAITDSLTGIFNRAHFFDLAEQELVRALRTKRPMSVIMLDVDLFKQINDTYGHDCGDRVLHQLAQVCQRALRSIDIVGRYGGEEFVFLLPETSLPDAVALAKRLKGLIAAITVEHNGELVTMTASLGVAALQPHVDTIKELINQADIALYRAKRNGRNLVCYHEQTSAVSTDGVGHS
ncbi:sensor domain-containing diguanylate cyclase [Ferrimonas lipolytica]|uniref:diguanylate cyclase n=1 Tax=Ferrimonas lipolytica TaxID=2724191 RepID=A0A6H1UDB3_9GAMM|nr:sensor domain-containing diguanylate cyclase [Ferrimonas lipolytica]QIZ76580.1 sensor domain-containing diguanylate cyclase [Ferrimonas lipolytica]